MQKITSIFFFFFIFHCADVAAFGAKSPVTNPVTKKSEGNRESTPETPRLERCVCPMIYMPVCGEDQKTYSNSCQANCAGVKVTTTGECEKTRDLEKN